MGELPANYKRATMTDDSELSERAQAYLGRKTGRPPRHRVWRHPPTPGPSEAWAGAKALGRRVTSWLSPVMVKNLYRGVPYGLIATPAAPRLADIDRDDPSQVRGYIATLRRLSPRSAAKLQDVPAWYDFKGGRRAAYRQIGNGIPVNLGRAVVRHLTGALGFSVPLPGSWAARGRTGLWPMDYLDICAPFPGVQGYPGAHVPGSVPEVKVEDPFARPLPSRALYERQRKAAERATEVLGAWDPVTGAWQVDWGWRPCAPRDYPAGFPDFDYFYQYIQGEGHKVTEHFQRIYEDVGVDLGLV